MKEFVLNANLRSDFGKKASRRLRAEGHLPANIYGHKQDNASVTLDSKEFRMFFEAGHRMATLDVDGKSEHGVVKEVQWDGMGNEILHVDFSRIDKDEKIELEVHVDVNGVLAAGVAEFPHKELKIRGPASALPESVEIRVGELKMGDAIRIKDVVVPDGCEVVGDPEGLVFACNAPRGIQITDGGEDGEAGPSEPEVIGKSEDGGDSD